MALLEELSLEVAFSMLPAYSLRHELSAVLAAHLPPAALILS